MALIHFYKHLPSSVKELSQNSMYSMFGAFLSKALLFLVWVLLAKILSVEKFGEFGIIRGTVLMFANFVAFGLGLASNKYIAEYKNSNKIKVGKIIGLTYIFGLIIGIIASFILWFFSDKFAVSYLNAPQLVNELQLSALILLFSAYNGSQLGILQGFNAFRKIAQISVIQILISLPLFLIGANYFGVIGAVFAFLVYNITVCVLSYFVIRKECRIRQIKIYYFDFKSEIDIIIKFSIPIVIGSGVAVFLQWYSQALLTRESGMYQMGLFTAAITFQSMIMMIADTLNAPMLSYMSENKSLSTESKLDKLNILIPWILGIFGALIFIFFPEIGTLIFGREYKSENFDNVFVIISLYSIVLLYKYGFGRILVVHNLLWWGVAGNLINAFTMLLTFLFFKKYGAMGLAFSFLMGQVVTTLAIMPVYVKKRVISLSVVISKEAIFIWLLLALSTSVHTFIDNILARVILYLLVMIIIGILMKEILRSKKLQVG